MDARPLPICCDAFEVDGTIAPVTVLRLKTADVDAIEGELRARGPAARAMSPYAPVVVDLVALDEADALELPLHDLAERLRACKLNPVGAANLPPSAVWNAAAAGIAVVELAAATPPTPPPVATPPVATPASPIATPPPPVEAAAAATLTIRQPVRSGQVIYAKRADLVVLAPVNPGAQVIADGHIHVYGALRGRAIAGAQGMADACVFCRSLEAELVAIAGRYLPAEAIPRERRGAPAQLSVENGEFRIDPL